MYGFNMKAALTVLLLAAIDATDSKNIHSRQKRAWIIDSFSIEEENPGPFPYTLGTIQLDRTYLVTFDLLGSGVNEDPKGILRINQHTGVITVLGPVDYEQYDKLKLTFQAQNVTNGAVDTRLGVEISILDINDHPPTFQQEHYEITIKESMAQGSTLIVLSARDDDKPNTKNSTFSYRIASVIPKETDAEFYIDTHGKISFKGCLDYEKAHQYTIIVEAKDQGEKVRLSSSATVVLNLEDDNNNLPVLLNQKASGKVKERDEGVTVLRIQVNDKDTKPTPAWKAKYSIEGDKDGNFQILTDPETNDGILTVVKSLDYESGNRRNLSITVRNEADYFSCIVKKRNPTTLWDVDVKHYDSSKGQLPPLIKQTVDVIVEDVNDPPEFTTKIKDVYVVENTEIGHVLETFTAVDQDDSLSSEFVYEIGNDPAGWVTVDPKTGVVKTIKKVDRESPYVVNNTYTIVIHAIDKGNPPMTGTGTLKIHLSDVNDNTPTVANTTIDMCLEGGPSNTTITAIDMDADPYSGPFRFQLINEKEMKGKWRLEPSYGYSVDLIKESNVFSGVYEVSLKIFDKQEQYSVQNLTVTVCDCVSSGPPNCRFRKSPAAQMGASAIGIIFVVLFLFLGLLLLALTFAGEKEKFRLINDNAGNTLLTSNTETPGTDCMVPHTGQQVNTTQVDAVNGQNAFGIYQQFHSKNAYQVPHTGQQINTTQVDAVNGQNAFGIYQQFHNKNAYQSIYRNPSYQSTINQYHHKHHQQNHHYMRKGSQRSHTGSTVSSRMRSNGLFFRKEKLQTIIKEQQLSLQSNGNELHDYPPHIYADEGEPMSDPELDPISIDEQEFVSDQLHDLGPKFNDLAATCMPVPKTH
ncbi:cadherin-like protein 26 isoform X1 [Lepisosteus oculatus]|uniref:cadherin-like protein 26 isoform X1 n=1 Tax=Lepisosteus oculatus TaxID=7918 RepID=UPI0035F51116